jgi:hypothetical protein
MEMQAGWQLKQRGADEGRQNKPTDRRDGGWETSVYVCVQSVCGLVRA